METVLIVGATGNIGVSAVKAVLQTGRHVLAAVRNQTSAEKLFHHVGTKDGITTVEADICSENGVQGIVDLVKAGKLPAFQHVYAAGLFIHFHGFGDEDPSADIKVAGGGYSATPLQDISTEDLRQIMTVNFESNFCTSSYLPRLGWTITDN